VDIWRDCGLKRHLPGVARRAGHHRDLVKSLYPAEIRSVRMLGSERELKWSLGEAGITMQTPAERPCEHAFVFKIVRGDPYPG
jgi:hypothetical protein